MKTLTLTGLSTPVARLGLGCMGMSEFYGSSDDAQSLKVMARAVELGVTLFDTADMYGEGRNEELVGQFLKTRRDAVTLATKCGIIRNNEPAARSIDTSPDYIKAACDASLKRLGVEVIDLYYLHRLDGVTPIEDSMGALADLAKAGKIRAAGLSEVSASTLKRAHAVFPVSALQSEYSLTTRDPESDGTLETCREIGAAFVAYSPLGRGLLAGAFRSPDDLEDGDLRKMAYFPRFQGDNLAANVALADLIAQMASDRGVTPAQLALAWLLSKDGVLPIPGTRKIERLEENARALEFNLSAADIQALEAATPPDAVKGTRYAEGGMAVLSR
ncbi:MAG: aldo/keto reductase [Oceanicaulis sp.]|uniref:aldo/keto reductase n=1 Tax=unclassified Oceanicaulis TaxID=2632123 RepID=UPI000C460927|nr:MULTISPECIES: aldo/keto reductase [unclassified Oceanicaulis]MBC38016.1 aldo/keto reductase [Oceanicaulis sp.]MBG36691.1 aldo/keto reductase [Oceanicaulis sp.]HBU61641.1 aldo/keto reductase [Oceanicaulis sp.]